MGAAVGGAVVGAAVVVSSTVVVGSGSVVVGSSSTVVVVSSMVVVTSTTAAVVVVASAWSASSSAMSWRSSSSGLVSLPLWPIHTPMNKASATMATGMRTFTQVGAARKRAHRPASPGCSVYSESPGGPVSLIAVPSSTG